MIAEMEVCINNGSLNQADMLQGALDDLLSDFISAACNPAPNPEIDTAQERKFINQVDGEVFVVKRMLADAKSQLEVLIPRIEASPMSQRPIPMVNFPLFLFLKRKTDLRSILVRVLVVVAHAANVAREAIPVVENTVRSRKGVLVQQAVADQDQVYDQKVASKAHHPPALLGKKQWKRRQGWPLCMSNHKGVSWKRRR